jgi:DNA topoisomerase III
VCNVAERIIGKRKEGGGAGGPPLLGAAVVNGHGTCPPTPAMKRFADSLVRQKRIKPPPGYKTSISICRKFLDEHAPKKAEGETPGKLHSKPVVLFVPDSFVHKMRRGRDGGDSRYAARRV